MEVAEIRALFTRMIISNSAAPPEVHNDFAATVQTENKSKKKEEKTMKHKLFYTLGLIVLVMAAFAASPAEAQTTASGPYYATPSWDQTLPVSTRFIVLSNMGSAAVLDRETGLVWEKSPRTSTVNWYDAHSICNELIVGNRKGWRLPTYQELASLVDPSVPFPGPILPNGHPFVNVQTCGSIPGVCLASAYWTVTPETDTVNWPNNIVLAMTFICPSCVKFGPISPDTQLNVWCVRGGLSSPQ